MNSEFDEFGNESNAQFIMWLKKMIIFNFNSVSEFSAKTKIYNATEWSMIFNGAKKLQLNKAFAAMNAIGVKITFEAPGVQPWCIGQPLNEGHVLAKISESKEQSRAEKEAQKLNDAKAKEARRRWHKFRHLILPDPIIEFEADINDEGQVLQVIHRHIQEMFPIIANILDNLAVIGFVMVKDRDQNRFFLLQNQGWPNLVIPMDLEECGKPCEHPFQNLFSTRYEGICRMANEREIIWWYFAVFLPNKRKLEAMLEAGCPPEAQNMKHYFGADSIEFFGLVRNSKTGKTPPMHQLRHLEWDYINGIDESYFIDAVVEESEEE